MHDTSWQLKLLTFIPHLIRLVLIRQLLQMSLARVRPRMIIRKRIVLVLYERSQLLKLLRALLLVLLIFPYYQANTAAEDAADYEGNGSDYESDLQCCGLG